MGLAQGGAIVVESIKGYDSWRLADGWVDAPLHTHCECGVELQTYHEEVEGSCRRCEKLREREAAEQTEEADIRW